MLTTKYRNTLLKCITLICSPILSCQSVSKDNSDASIIEKYSHGIEYVFKPYSNDEQTKIKSLMSLLREKTSYLIVELTLIDGCNYETENLVKKFRFKRDKDVTALLNAWANSTQWGCWVLKNWKDYVFDQAYYNMKLYFYDENGVLLNNGILFNEDFNDAGVVYISTQNQPITIKKQISNWKRLPNISKMHDTWIESVYKH